MTDHDPDLRKCPACGKTFVVIDMSDCQDYEDHLTGHLRDGRLRVHNDDRVQSR